MANLGEDVAKLATDTGRVKHSAIGGVNKFGTISRVSTDADLGTPMPPSGLEAGLTDRFDNPTYYG